MSTMSEIRPLPCKLPPSAEGAVIIVKRLVKAGHSALLAGGCTRDLLLGRQPTDYDVATDAPPERISALFRTTRMVGAQFGVVLVRQQRLWIEVATFRTDGPYRDGRHPDVVRFTNAREDARRRDFTVNGMFLDPLARTVIDYVGGQTDLEAGIIRAIGEPTARFEEDHLRLVRAVRFAARLAFEIEPVTLAAIRENADKLTRVAAERVCEELRKMLEHSSRQVAYRLLHETGLLPHLWPAATWEPTHIAAAEDLLGRLPADAGFELAFAALLADRPVQELERITRALTFSNEQRVNVAWLVQHRSDLQQPESCRLAALKRLMAHQVFHMLRQWTEVDYETRPDGPQRRAVLHQRLAAIPPESIAPAPFATGDDLAQRRLPPGPLYAEILDILYTRQLDESLRSRTEALAALDELLRERGALQ
ncbi:MAG: CCA tRNA nucleotidyltransferase [Planctomycetota bacterium]